MDTEQYDVGFYGLMDPKHPPTLRSIGPTETDLYKKLDTLVKEFKGEEVKPS